jgi:hypothetical protein
MKLENRSPPGTRWSSSRLRCKSTRILSSTGWIKGEGSSMAASFARSVLSMNRSSALTGPSVLRVPPRHLLQGSHNDRRGPQPGLPCRQFPLQLRQESGCASCMRRTTSLKCTAANGIPIEGWVGDKSDECLLDLLPLLDSLRFTTDVRRVLGIRGFGVIQAGPVPP